MNWKELLEELSDAFKVPETKEEAIDWINKDPSSQTLIEEMAFRQVVINILVAANIISEKDFNDSIRHFKNLFTERFAEEMLAKIDDFNKQYSMSPTDDSPENEDDDWDDWPEDGKKIYQA